MSLNSVCNPMDKIALLDNSFIAPVASVVELLQVTAVDCIASSCLTLYVTINYWKL